MAFIPLVSLGRVIGKFMLYYAAAAHARRRGAAARPRDRGAGRLRRGAHARRGTRRGAARSGSALPSTPRRWARGTGISPPRPCGGPIISSGCTACPPGTFDGTFTSYEREIHPDDRERVFASVRRALAEGVPHDVEYRIVAPDGPCAGAKARGGSSMSDGQPVRMSGVCMMVTRRKEAELARLAAAEEVQPPEGRLPGDPVARAADAAERHPRLGADAPERQRLPPDRAAPGDRHDRPQRRLQAQLIEDILDVSRIITGKLEIERAADRRSPQLVDTVVGGDRCRPPRPGKSTSRDGRPTTCRRSTVTPSGCTRSSNNVLSNAVKFTPEGGRIDVECGADDRRGQVIVVQDSGAGIAAGVPAVRVRPLPPGRQPDHSPAMAASASASPSRVTSSSSMAGEIAADERRREPRRNLHHLPAGGTRGRSGVAGDDRGPPSRGSGLDRDRRDGVKRRTRPSPILPRGGDAHPIARSRHIAAPPHPRRRAFIVFAGLACAISSACGVDPAVMLRHARTRHHKRPCPSTRRSPRCRGRCRPILIAAPAR